ncbi:MAG: hypothetical protein ACO33A_06955 [Hyphomonas sp.]
MTRSEANETPVSALRDTSWLSLAAIVLIVLILGSVAADMAGKVGSSVVTRENWLDVLNAFLLALLVNSPTLIIIGVLSDFAGLFGRTGEGEVFTARNLKTLRSAGSGLIWAAAASSIIVPRSSAGPMATGAASSGTRTTWPSARRPWALPYSASAMSSLKASA